MLDNKLIESALQLTGKTMSDVKIYNPSMELEVSYQFSIEKFSYYLLSPSFIEKYREIRFKNLDKTTIDCIVLLNKNWTIVSDFWEAIYEYQSWDENHLIELLKKI